MNAERFAALADAFGGSITRWPGAEQDAAWAFLAEQPEAAQDLLAQARTLDETLDEAERLSPSHALRSAVVALAPVARAPRPLLVRWLTGAGIGVGLAAAAVAGLAIGVNASLANAGEDAVLLAALYGSDLIDRGEVS
jgi:hypothetical protein